MNIYKFNKNDESGHIYVAAMSILEAINAITSLNVFGSYIYDFKKFNFFIISPDKYQQILHLGDEYLTVPRFISENEYNLLYKYSYKDLFKDKQTYLLGCQNEILSEITDQNNSIIRKEIDKSVGENFIDEIGDVYTQNKLNEISKKYDLEYNNKEIENTVFVGKDLSNFKKDINELLSKYIFELNNQKTRKNILNDICNIIDKYTDFINCIDETVENNNENKILNKLKNNIKGED